MMKIWAEIWQTIIQKRVNTEFGLKLDLQLLYDLINIVHNKYGYKNRLE